MSFRNERRLIPIRAHVSGGAKRPVNVRVTSGNRPDHFGLVGSFYFVGAVKPGTLPLPARAATAGNSSRIPPLTPGVVLPPHPSAYGVPVLAQRDPVVPVPASAAPTHARGERVFGSRWISFVFIKTNDWQNQIETIPSLWARSVRELCRAAVKPGVNACKGGHTPGALPS